MARTTLATDRYIKSMAAAARELAPRLASQHAAPDTLAQAIVCAQPILTSNPQLAPQATQWLLESLTDWEQQALHLATDLPPLPLAPSLSLPLSTAAHLYEPFLHHYARRVRRRHGVFFTPQPIANYIVNQINRLLIEDFALPQGLAAHSAISNPQSAIQILDPACGTGVFLLAAIDHLHERLGRQRLGDNWNDFVPNLLPRLMGVELLPVAAFLAKLNIAMKLAATGYDFREPGRIHIHTGDALDPSLQSKIQNPKSKIAVVLGNPPFSSLTTNTNPWIARLVRGEGEVRGYVQAGDQRLAERKTWLHDDYVKFIRLAQWYVEETGQGIVGLVTNHGYLDNTTFRLMRHELARVFQRVHIVDLHGNRKKGEVAPDGSRDENVFGLDQGVAIGIFTKPTRSGIEGAPRVEYSELWGTRDEKLESLGSTPSLALQACVVTPTAPHWRFVPGATVVCPHYDAGWPLTEVMPVNTSAPVTARDHFVVAFTEEELCRRVTEFRDLAIGDDEIRHRYFTRTRSSRYQPGDTRGWKLAEARRAVAADEHWRQHIRRCLYRPFDWRYVFWHPAMIDWPRNEVTRHLMPGLSAELGTRNSERRPALPAPRPALCLITRRQQLPTQSCTFFWIADGLAIDGVIRSDNRGSESLFPLWLAASGGQANFAPAFLAEIELRTAASPTAEDLLGYIYALFHSPTYRERYAARLREDFPRVLLPRCSDLFSALASIGRRLVDLHLLRYGALRLSQNEIFHDGGSSPAKDGGPTSFRVGGYVVPQKWLQPKHRQPGDSEHSQIVAAIDQTLHLMIAIDEAIGQHGGFPSAFESKPRPVVGVLGDPTSAAIAP